MEIGHQTRVSFSFSALLFCILGSFSLVNVTVSELQTQYSSLLLQSSNDPNFTLSTETESDIKSTEHGNVSWQTNTFQLANISTLLTNYNALPFPSLNDSRFFISEEAASLTVTIKNFSGFLLYFNFSYYIGVNSAVTTSTPLPNSISSEGFQLNNTDEEESKKLAMTIASEKGTELLKKSILSAMTHNILLATKKKQQANQTQQATPQTSTPSLSQLDHENSTTANLVHETSGQNGTVTESPVANPVDSQAALNSTILEVKSVVSTNQSSDNFNKTDSISDTRSMPIKISADNQTELLPVTMEKVESLLNSTESPKENVHLKDNVTELEETKTISVTTNPLPAEPEPKTMTQDVARKKRSINSSESEDLAVPIQHSNDDAEIVNVSGDNITHKETPSPDSEVKKPIGESTFTGTDTAKANEKSQITSGDSDTSLPADIAEIIKDAAEAIAAAAASGQISLGTNTGSPISDAQMALPPIPPADEQKSTNFGGSAPIKETDSTPSSSSLTASATDVKTENVIRKIHSHHHEHYHHKSKSNPASEHSLDSHHHERSRKTKKAENVERGENDGVGTKVNDEGDSSSSSSSSSEEDDEHGGAGKKKISYKTWRASLEKRNRPPGLFVTVNDNIIFDNWEGIWDKPQVLGRWTGSLKAASKDKWNQTYISTSWEDAAEHDIKITFEWEPTHENAVVILSDIIVSTISVPPTCSEPKAESPTNKDVKIVTLNQSEQNEPLASTNAAINDTIDVVNEFKNDSSTEYDVKEHHLKDTARERQVLKIMQKIGNDDMEAERIAHEIMKNLTAKESDDISLETILRKLPYNIKEALLLHAQRVLNENVSISTPNPNATSETSTVSSPSASTSMEASTTSTSTSATILESSTSPTTISTVTAIPITPTLDTISSTSTTSASSPTGIETTPSTSTSSSMPPSTSPTSTMPPSTITSPTATTVTTSTSPPTIPEASFSTTPLSSTQTASSTTMVTDAIEKESSSTSTIVFAVPSPPIESSSILENGSTWKRPLVVRPEKKTDSTIGLLVFLLTGVITAGILTFLVWRKMEVKRGRNAAR